MQKLLKSAKNSLLPLNILSKVHLDVPQKNLFVKMFRKSSENLT